ncbi:sigma-70 RNA polymerase sigma factor region 4 domain-containing protein [Pedobacter sp.]
MNEGLLKILDAQDWDDVIIKLTAYVVQYCKWKKYYLPKGLEAEDIALSAIEKIYTGERSWDMEKEPDLQNHLQSVTNSIIINEIRSGAAGEKRIEIIPEDYHAVSNSVEEELYCKQLDREIATSMRGDPMVCLVYKALKDGLPPREIAEEYSVDILQIRLAQKRLRRLAERVIDQLSKVNYHE